MVLSANDVVASGDVMPAPYDPLQNFLESAVTAYDKQIVQTNLLLPLAFVGLLLLLDD